MDEKGANLLNQILTRERERALTLFDLRRKGIEREQAARGVLGGPVLIRCDAAAESVLREFAQNTVRELVDVVHALAQPKLPEALDWLRLTLAREIDSLANEIAARIDALKTGGRVQGAIARLERGRSDALREVDIALTKVELGVPGLSRKPPELARVGKGRMYNLLVAGHAHAWDGRPFRLKERSRVLTEYTDPDLTARFCDLYGDALVELLALPSVFAYERGLKTDPLFGRLTHVSRRENDVRIDYEIIPIHPFLTWSQFEDMGLELGIDDRFEFGSQHWSVKEVDLRAQLALEGILLPEQPASTSGGMTRQESGNGLTTVPPTPGSIPGPPTLAAQAQGSALLDPVIVSAGFLPAVDESTRRQLLRGVEADGMRIRDQREGELEGLRIDLLRRRVTGSGLANTQLAAFHLETSDSVLTQIFGQLAALMLKASGDSAPPAAAAGALGACMAIYVDQVFSPLPEMVRHDRAASGDPVPPRFSDEAQRMKARFAQQSATAVAQASVGRGRVPVPQPGSATPDHVVVVIHGIRTHASWGEMVKQAIEQHPLTHCVVVRYDYFDVFRFLCPILTRRGPVRRVQEKLAAVHARYKAAEISVVAHSFGAFVISRILETDPHFRLKRLLLCGSVVPSSYRWDVVAHKIGDDVLNDCGTEDLWPILASSATWGYGASGTFGFGDPKVKDRFHRITHGGYFDQAFVDRFWIPYLTAGTVVGTTWDVTRPAAPAWQSLLARGVLRKVGLALVLALMLLLLL